MKRSACREFGAKSALLVGLCLVGCSSHQVASTYVKSALIRAAQGGTLVITAADVPPGNPAAAALVGTSIAIPPGALATDQTIGIATSARAVAPAGTQEAGPVATFDPDGLTFLAPVTLALPVAAGATAAKVAIAAVENSGLTRQLAVTEISGGLATFHASGFTSFGAFLLPCADGGLSCDAGCVDPTTDPSNCGACGTTCGTGESCGAGQCAGPDGGQPNDGGTCEAGLTACTAGCVNTRSDPTNCGSCGTVCLSGTCNVGPDDAGVCLCSAPDVVCADVNTGQPVCVDPMSDPNYCGGCAETTGVNCDNLPGAGLAGQVLPGIACLRGSCVCGQAGQGIICQDGCQDPQNDPNNCGGCGASDPRFSCQLPNNVCQRGQCVCPLGLTFCGADGGTPSCRESCGP